MIIRAESRLKAEQTAIVNLNEEESLNTGTTNYREILGLTYNNNNANLIPSSFKWGSSLIKFVD